ncbi:MAG: hypothetical protein KDD78_07475, partial [Caldilineaceae bacterium]|nr:hypothetical protein [Caldilineaceae bacterium]
EIPESFQSLSKLTKLNLTYNALSAGSSALNSFLEARNPGWAATQTVPPSALVVGQVQQTDVQLVWTPIAYVGDGGAYQIQYGTTSGGPYPFSVQTGDKVADSIWISGLTPNTEYYFVVVTHTPAHDNQQNAVTSEFTQEISATTLNSGSGSVDCYLLRRSHQGQGDEIAAIPTSSTGCDAGKYVAGEALTLFANPATDWRIGSWSGTDDDTGTGTTNALTMPANSHDVAVEYVQLPIVTFAAAELSLPEGSGRAQIRLRLNKITPAPLAVTVTSENGSATGGTDFVQLNRAVTFAPGSQEASFEFEVLDDSADEGNETLTLRLSAPQGVIVGTATATIIIGDDDSTSGGDVYESDNSCADFSVIATDGTVQRHTFHQANDQDWVRFDVAEQHDYMVQVSVPPDSPADVIIDLRLECDSLPVQSQGYTFSPGARLDFRAPRSGPIYVRLLDNDPQLGTSQAIYDLAVRHLQGDAQVGAAIVVAGSIKQNDPVQPNIYNVTDAAYQMFLDNGYDADRILYLAPDLSHDPVKVDLLANVDNLRNGITQWAKSRVDADRALTIYLMDHGDQDRLYLDKERLQWIEPDDLDAMLDQLEAEVEGLKVNVIIEACYSGSFISGASSISKPGRVIVTSVDDENLAWASTTGAYFSDHFIAALRRGESLYTSFNAAKAAVQTAHPTQIAWIDADGDASALDDASQSPAAQRGFSMPGTFPPSRWPPFIAEVDETIQVEDGVALIRARVVDDEDGVSVHAVIYGPGYKAPTTGEEMILESTQVLQTVVLLDQGKDWYGVNYPGFRDPGTYRIVIYAQDRSGTQGQPRTIDLVVEGIPSPLDETNLYLPLLRR